MNKKKVFLIVVGTLISVFAVASWLTFLGLTGGVTGTTSICINPPPTISAINDQTISHGTNLVLPVNATDPRDNSTLVYFENISIFSINSTTGVINLTTNVSHIGNYSVNVTVNDSSSGCPLKASSIFSLVINNTAPAFSLVIANQSWEQDVELVGINLNTSFSDPDGDVLNYSYTGGDNMVVSITSIGNVSLTPDTGWSGTSWIVFTANDSMAWTDSNNITLTIAAAVAASDDDVSDLDPPGGGAGYFVEGCKWACDEWGPTFCSEGEEQTRECHWEGLGCTYTTEIEERDCVCKSRWQCTVWKPRTCSAGEVQNRDCVDLNSCGIDILPLERNCPEKAVEEPEKEERRALTGMAFFQDLVEGKGSAVILAIVAGVVVLLLIVLALVFYLKRRKRPPITGQIGENDILPKVNPPVINTGNNQKSQLAGKSEEVGFK